MAAAQQAYAELEDRISQILVEKQSASEQASGAEASAAAAQKELKSLRAAVAAAAELKLSLIHI